MEETDNPGISKGLITYIAVLDSVLKDSTVQCLENSTIFKGTSKVI